MDKELAAQTKNDFIAHMAIASKVTRESKDWIELLIKINYLERDSKLTNSLPSKYKR